LGEREAFVDERLADAAGKIGSGDVAGTARDISVASNLESETGFPLFQYSGPDLHAGCTSAPEACITRAPVDEAVQRALNYLLEGEKVQAFVAGLGADERRSLLPHIALDRDPDLAGFYAALIRADEAANEIEKNSIETLKSEMLRAASVAAGLDGHLRGASAPGDGGAALERARRMAGGFAKDFEGVEALVDSLQLRRLKQRVANLLESEADIRAANEAMGGGGDSAVLSEALALVSEFRERDVVAAIDAIEAGLAGLQVELLGRPVHSQEHWQYLRELAFKYPVSPLLCCIRRLNDRYMVVPRRDGEITRLLGDFLEKA
jgi:hypothetical protein